MVSSSEMRGTSDSISRAQALDGVDDQVARVAEHGSWCSGEHVAREGKLATSSQKGMQPLTAGICTML